MAARLLMILGAAFSLSPWCSGPLALGLGIALALPGLTAWSGPSKRFSRLLIQVCIVLLGLAIDLHRVQQAGVGGLAFAAGTIVLVFALGAALGRLLGVPGTLGTLLSSGTAICGGSAIAATSRVIRADDSDTSIALAAVFVLNAIALFVFIPVGHWLAMSQEQFGTWAAVAIHDMASVVAAGKEYGPAALEQATVVKLTRVLWIVPVAAACGWAASRRAPGAGAPGGNGWAAVRGALPWFIVLFVLASAVRTYVPGVGAHEATVKAAAKAGMTLALFLIGCGLSRAAVERVGARPFVMAAALWVVLSVVSLLVVRATVV